MEGDCFDFDNASQLEIALCQLRRILDCWVSPKPAAAPLARLGVNLTPAAKEEMQKLIDDLPPLDNDWQPFEPRQRSLFRKLRKRMDS
jgi:hypothetical protein